MPRIVVRVELHPLAGRMPNGAAGPAHVAVCKTGDCTWRSRPQVVKVAAEDEARYHREHHRREAVV